MSSPNCLRETREVQFYLTTENCAYFPNKNTVFEIVIQILKITATFIFERVTATFDAFCMKEARKKIQNFIYLYLNLHRIIKENVLGIIYKFWKIKSRSWRENYMKHTIGYENKFLKFLNIKLINFMWWKCHKIILVNL